MGNWHDCLEKNCDYVAQNTDTLKDCGIHFNFKEELLDDSDDSDLVVAHF